MKLKCVEKVYYRDLDNNYLEFEKDKLYHFYYYPIHGEDDNVYKIQHGVRNLVIPIEVLERHFEYHIEGVVKL